MPSAPVERRAPEPRNELRLEDPAALRALAHPARQRVVAALYAGGEALTATQAARLCGLSASAMSYHLRALEKWGIVRRGESSDGRERPWVAAADDFSIPSGAYRGIDAAVTASLVGSWADEIAAGVRRAGETMDDESGLSTLRNIRLWLTRPEADEVHAAIDAALDRFRDRTSRDHPDGAVPMDAYLLLLPADPNAVASERGRRPDEVPPVRTRR